MAPDQPTSAARANAAAEVSDDVFGPRLPRDDAYGAFQRGYFLTALATGAAARRKGRRRGADADRDDLRRRPRRRGRTSPPPRAGTRSRARTATCSRPSSSRCSTRTAAACRRTASAPPSSSPRPPRWAACPAKYNLALLHVEGRYVEPNLAKAAALMKEAADAGLARGAVRLRHDADRRRRHRPRPGGRRRAVEARRRSGPVRARRSTTRRCSISAAACRADREAAATLVSPCRRRRQSRSRRTGSPSCSPSAKGVSLDLEEAAMWRALARRQGLNDPQLDELLVSISTDDLAAAEERARFWPSEPPATVADAATEPDIRIIDTRTHDAKPLNGLPGAAARSRAPPRPRKRRMARSALLNVMVQAAIKAGRSLTKDFGEVENLQVSRKGPADFVSNADKRAEEIVFNELQQGPPDLRASSMEEGSEVEGHRRPAPLDRRSARRHHQLPPLDPAVRDRHCARAQRRDRRLGDLQPGDGRALHRRKGRRRLAQRPPAPARRGPQAPGRLP